MGWTSMYTGFNSKDSKRIKEFLINEWEKCNNFKVIDYSKKGNVVYMAVESLEKKDIFATVTLISFEDGEFYWKDMDESMGPCYPECPQRILKLLTPTSHEFAIKWRESCWDFHKQNKENINKYKHGDILVFPREISFSDGFEGTEFILIKQGRRFVFSTYSGQTDIRHVYPEYRITKWRESKPNVIGNIAS